MKKFGAVFALLAAIGLALFVVKAAFFIFSGEGDKMDASSKAYADKAAVEIMTNWDAKTCMAFGSKDFNASVTTESLKKGLDSMKAKIGPMQEYKGSKGYAKIKFEMGIGIKKQPVTATYTCTGKFKKGEYTANILLILQDGEWKMRYFQMD